MLVITNIGCISPPRSSHLCRNTATGPVQEVAPDRGCEGYRGGTQEEGLKLLLGQVLLEVVREATRGDGRLQLRSDLTTQETWGAVQCTTVCYNATVPGYIKIKVLHRIYKINQFFLS